MKVLLNKRKGRYFEMIVRKVFNRDFYTITKGVSTKGTDIVAIGGDYILLIEVKNTSRSWYEIFDKKQRERVKKNFNESLEQILSKTILKPLPLVIIKDKEGFHFFLYNPSKNAFLKLRTIFHNIPSILELVRSEVLNLIEDALSEEPKNFIYEEINI